MGTGATVYLADDFTVRNCISEDLEKAEEFLQRARRLLAPKMFVSIELPGLSTTMERICLLSKWAANLLL